MLDKENRIHSNRIHSFENINEERKGKKKENAKGNTNPIMSPLFRKLYNFFF